MNAWELNWPKRILPMVKKRRLAAGLHEDPAAVWAKQAGPERGLLTTEQVHIYMLHIGVYTTYSSTVIPLF